MTKPLEYLDYVLATKYSDGDPNDHWVVGFYIGMTPKANSDRYMIVDSNGHSFRGNGFRRAKKISHARGAWLLAHAEEIQSSTRSVWGWARKSMNKDKP